MSGYEEVHLPGDEPVPPVVAEAVAAVAEVLPEARALEMIGRMAQPGAKPVNWGWFQRPAAADKFHIYCVCGEWLVGWFSEARWEKLHTAPWRKAHTGDGHEVKANAKQAAAARARLTEALMAPPGKCRSCQQPVLWAKTGGDKAMPIDPAPAEGGNVLLSAAGGGLAAKVLTAGERAAVACALYVSHFTSCPHADEHRRRR